MSTSRRSLFCALLACIAIACGVVWTMPTSDTPGEDHGSTWIASPEDNICGLSDLRLVVRPACVDYDRLLRATPEIRRIERENIDVESALGVILYSAAVDRVRSACDVVRAAMNHCSVWKTIRRVDGRPIADRTEDVIVVIKKAVEALPPPERSD